MATNKKAKPKGKAKSKATPKVPPASDTSIEEALLESIRGVIGDDGALLLGSDGLAIKIRGVIPTACPSIDHHVIGRGGAPLGRLTILHGAEGSGKTTIALMIVAACQRAGGAAVYVDKEHKLDPDYAKTLGVDTDRLIISYPNHLESFFAVSDSIIDKAKTLRKKGARVPILIVLDSMNAAITKAQFEGDWEQKHMAPQARVFSELLPKLIPKVHREDVALLFISQVRKKMNVMFGDDEEIAGGKAARFYASLIMYITRLGSKKDEKTNEKVSNKIRIEAKKNQISPPFRKAELQIIYGLGVDKELDMLQFGATRGLVEKNGSWWSYEGKRLGQGDSAASEALRADPDLAQRLTKAIEAQD